MMGFTSDFDGLAPWNGEALAKIRSIVYASFLGVKLPLISQRHGAASTEEWAARSR